MFFLCASLCSFVANKSAISSPSAPDQFFSLLTFVFHPKSFVFGPSMGNFFAAISPALYASVTSNHPTFVNQFPLVSQISTPFPTLFRPQKEQQLKLYKTERYEMDTNTKTTFDDLFSLVRSCPPEQFPATPGETGGNRGEPPISVLSAAWVCVFWGGRRGGGGGGGLVCVRVC